VLTRRYLIRLHRTGVRLLPSSFAAAVCPRSSLDAFASCAARLSQRIRRRIDSRRLQSGFWTKAAPVFCSLQTWASSVVRDLFPSTPSSPGQTKRLKPSPRPPRPSLSKPKMCHRANATSCGRRCVARALETHALYLHMLIFCCARTHAPCFVFVVFLFCVPSLAHVPRLGHSRKKMLLHVGLPAEPGHQRRSPDRIHRARQQGRRGHVVCFGPERREHSLARVQQP
jgi:hypothetical protein